MRVKEPVEYGEAVGRPVEQVAPLHLSARESVGAGLCVAAVAFGLLLAAVASLKAGTR